MGDSHRHLLITSGEWDVFMDDVQISLDQFGVPLPEREELRAIVQSTRDAIVMVPGKKVWKGGPSELSVALASMGAARWKSISPASAGCWNDARRK